VVKETAEATNNGGGGMPAIGDKTDPEHARLLSKKEIDDVAGFVSQGTG
jgi:hypothetical protein